MHIDNVFANVIAFIDNSVIYGQYYSNKPSSKLCKVAVHIGFGNIEFTLIIDTTDIINWSYETTFVVGTVDAYKYLKNTRNKQPPIIIHN